VAASCTCASASLHAGLGIRMACALLRTLRTAAPAHCCVSSCALCRRPRRRTGWFDCRSEFKEVRLLGEGNFSVVRAAKHRLDGVEYAIKRSTKDITDAASKKQWVQVRTHCLCSLACG
jgi:hypothetical protein